LLQGFLLGKGESFSFAGLGWIIVTDFLEEGKVLLQFLLEKGEREYSCAIIRLDYCYSFPSWKGESFPFVRVSWVIVTVSAWEGRESIPCTIIRLDNCCRFTF
jgi:hypothetical protein